MTHWEKYRELFPHLPEKVYLNHAAISPMNLRTRAALDQFFDNRLDKDIEYWPIAIDQKQRLYQQIGQLINAPAENIALVPNTSAGLNVLALGLDWKAGDRILLNNFEFPSNIYPFVNLRRFGVEIDFVEHRDGALHLEDIKAKITPRTRLLAISFVEFMNGFKNDLVSLGKICRENNILFSVDAIQGLGALSMDMGTMGIDFLSTSGHKWLMWPAGIGFIYISPNIFDSIYPAQAGWLSVEVPWDFFNYEQKFAPTAQRFEPGTVNTTGIIAANTSLEMMLEIGPSSIEEKILQNTNYLIGNLQDTGIRLFTKTGPANKSGIVSFYYDKAEALFEHLKSRDIFVSLREGRIRISPHFYNNFEDIDRLISQIRNFK